MFNNLQDLQKSYNKILHFGGGAEARLMARAVSFVLLRPGGEKQVKNVSGQK